MTVDHSKKPFKFFSLIFDKASKEKTLVKMGNLLVKAFASGLGTSADNPGNRFSCVTINGFDDHFLFFFFWRKRHISSNSIPIVF